MRKIFIHVCLAMIFTIMLSSISFGAGDTISLEEAYKTINKDKGKFGYIIGKFPMTHYKDGLYGTLEIGDRLRDINPYSRFSIRFNIVEAEKKKKKYTVFLKPVTGSDTTAYYPGREEYLLKNTIDPFWVLKVPAGSYELEDFICSLTLNIPGYHDWRGAIYDGPMAKLINRSLNIQVQEKQIVYIGDYHTIIKTFISLDKDNRVYPFGNILIQLQNGFEEAKNTFLIGADDKLKEKLNEYQVVSAL